jgi:peptide/nickel transport system substrate-binding protein
LDQVKRKFIYSQALDLIMDLAVELPTYQRKDLVVYNKDVIKAGSLNQDANAYEGVYDRLWEVDYN